jgi:hypothetical protein
MTAGRRRIPSQTYLFFYALFAALLFLTHTPYLKLPYFWDEVGLFIPAALDLYRTHSWMPHAPGFSAHPPGLMAFLAACWSVAGHTIPGTRIAMLLCASAALLAAFLLAIRLSQNLFGAPAFVVVMLMVVSPLFYAQAILAQPDLPAMLFTCLALLLFLQDRMPASAAACTALALVTPMGVVASLALGGCLAIEKRPRQAALFLAPLCALAVWLLAVMSMSGRVLGNYPFTRHNLLFLLHPVRFAAALLERLDYLFFAEFRVLGTLAIVFAVWRKIAVFRSRDWRVAGTLTGAHVLACSLFGDALLDRQLLPVLPIVYMAMIAAFSTLSRQLRVGGQLALGLGLVAGNIWSPPYPQPLDNNTAFTAFIPPQKISAEFLEFNYTGRRVLTAWPMGSAMSRPEFGYVQRGMKVVETPDFRASTLEKVDWSKVDVLLLYARHREPGWNLLNMAPLGWLRSRYFGYEREIPAPPSRAGMFEHVAHWSERGFWADVYLVRPGVESKQLFLIHDSVRK